MSATNSQQAGPREPRQPDKRQPRQPDKREPAIAIIGAGPAGLMAADVLGSRGWRVTVFERMPNVARKFLLAGRGGLNLTHQEDLHKFIGRYGPQQDWLRPSIEDFSPKALRQFADDLGQETFVGSSGRVFPKPMKASPMLRAWLERLAGMGVEIARNHEWIGFERRPEPRAPLHLAPLHLRFSVPASISLDERATFDADAVLLALGGASWSKLGSDGSWAALLCDMGIAVAPLRPSNCGFHAPWSDVFRQRFAGTPLKSIALTFAGQRVRGEALITAQGLQGGGVYALSPLLRDAIEDNGEALLTIDLRPDLSHATLLRRLAKPRAKQSMGSYLRKSAGLPPVAIALLREAMIHDTATPTAMKDAGVKDAGVKDRVAVDGVTQDSGGVRLPDEPDRLATLIQACPVHLTGTTGLNRAISTAGGIERGALDARFMLQAVPGVFAAGEMLDWEAPTGGYLLQASFATAVAAANGLDAWLSEQIQISS